MTILRNSWCLILLCITLPQASIENYPPWFQRRTFPRWFFEPPAKTVVGFDSAKPLRDDAYDRFCSFITMRTTGFLRVHQYEHLGQLLFTDEDSISFLYVPRTDVDTSDLILLDSLKSAVSMAGIFSTDSVAIDTTPLSLFETVAPPKDPNYIYGTGVSRVNLYNPLWGWMKAESRAIRNLMEQSVFSLYTLERSKDGRMERASWYDFDLRVENLEIVRRWFCAESGNAAVAVRVRKGSISPWKSENAFQLPLPLKPYGYMLHEISPH
ncbi:hypothetical protein [Chitinivibrio alkaliphilus]|uniref:Uncharacterized protein n=1 Tax=Chitinivibrio alkaliphilus ACht1 TaxID=1313304 RepID=U7D444_9BACT|nr:hypothetical protein [Chitinivibrio alkaliphilus]ERP30728.1 hypothetical protein CALK_2443 [Chitinivibrio alkaliphilus ACht1]